MSDPETSAPAWESMSNAERQSALFSNLVMQQTNAALLMLGQVPHPETGKAEVDLDGASLFIDTLEMLQNKTRGHLGQPEEALLKRSLTMLRMTFVEKVNAGTAAKPGTEAAPPPPGTTQTASAPTPETTEAESKIKFTKKY